MMRPDDLVTISELLARTGEPLGPSAPAGYQPRSARHVRRRQRRSGWPALIISSLARAALAVLTGLLFWSVAPVVTGWHPTVVLSGSMAPALHPGDVVITRAVPAAKLQPGQVVLVDDPDHPGRLRLHRLVGFDPQGRLILHGDANRSSDSDAIALSAVRGVGVLRVPLIGTPLYWWRSQQYLPVALTGAAVVLLSLLAGCYRPHPSAEAPHRRNKPRRRPAQLGAATVLAVVTAAQLVHPTPARAAYSVKTGNPNSTFSVAYLSCKSAILASNPSLFYRFEETSGTSMADSGPYGFTGAYSTGGVTYRTAGACPRDGGKSMTLDGSSGYAYEAGSVSNPTTFSTELWFRTTSNRGGWLIGMGSTTAGPSAEDDRVLYLTNNGQVGFGVLNGSAKTTIFSSSGYNDGNWHLADATFSPTTGMKLYLDGAAVAGNAAVTAAGNYSGYIRIGYDTLAGWPSAPTSSYFGGSLDEASAYAFVLPAADIYSHYNAGV